MAINTYGTLKTAVTNWLADSDLSTDRIAEHIAMAEDTIARDTRIRIRAMETSADVTISAQTASLPSGWLQGRRFHLDGNPLHKLDFMVPERFYEVYASSQTGKPDVFTIEGDNFVFGPSPDTTYTGKVHYYKKFDALSSDSDTNWILSNARGLLLYQSLVQAGIYLNHDSIVRKYAALYDSLADEVKAADQFDRYSGDNLRVWSDVYVDQR